MCIYIYIHIHTPNKKNTLPNNIFPQDSGSPLHPVRNPRFASFPYLPYLTLSANSVQ